MGFYITIIILLLILFLASVLHPKNKVIPLLSILMVCFIISFRDLSVGTDTHTYVDFFLDKDFYYFGAKLDLGFELIARFLRFLGGYNSNFFIFATSCCSLLGLAFIVLKTSKNVVLSTLLFCIMGTAEVFLFTYMSAIRQCCSLSFLFLGMYFLYQRKNNLYSVLLLIFSVLVHGSSMFLIPFIFWVWYKPFKKKAILYAIIISFIISTLSLIPIGTIMTFLLSSFGGLATKNYDSYGSLNFGQIGTLGFLNMYLLPFVCVSLFLIKKISEENFKTWYFQLFFLSVILNNIFCDNLMWSRLILGFSILIIIVIPNSLHLMTKKSSIIFCLIIFCYYFYKVFNQLEFMASPHAVGNIVIPYKSWFF